MVDYVKHSELDFFGGGYTVIDVAVPKIDEGTLFSHQPERIIGVDDKATDNLLKALEEAIGGAKTRGTEKEINLKRNLN